MNLNITVNQCNLVASLTLQSVFPVKNNRIEALSNAVYTVCSCERTYRFVRKYTACGVWGLHNAFRRLRATYAVLTTGMQVYPNYV